MSNWRDSTEEKTHEECNSYLWPPVVLLLCHDVTNQNRTRCSIKSCVLLRESQATILVDSWLPTIKVVVLTLYFCQITARGELTRVFIESSSTITIIKHQALVSKTSFQTDRQADRQTDRQTDIQTNSLPPYTGGGISSFK